jgi:hypothetical protein
MIFLFLKIFIGTTFNQITHSHTTSHAHSSNPPAHSFTQAKRRIKKDIQEKNDGMKKGTK